MNTIIVEKECGCFKRSAYENNMNFASIDEAEIQLNQMLNYMNNKFCQKHEFNARQDGDNFIISVNQKEEAQSGGCCGGGHCS
ncbi:MAG: hypothetical protein U9R39_00660 [Campylobacterota bacterium]|nr:hypothetical protein [Campylobacterota bacterium]